MKRKIAILNQVLELAAISLVCLSLSSCLKDKGPVQDFSQSPALVGFQYTGNSFTPFQTSILPNPNDSVNLEVTLSVASLTIKTPVTVNIALDQPTLDAYNADTTTNTYPTVWTMLPSNMYTIANNGVVTINPGQQIVSLVIHLAGDQIDYSKSPALAFKITSVTGALLASNLNKALYLFALKNQFDGQYNVTGTMTDVINSSITGKYPTVANLVTDGKTSCDYYDVKYLSDFYHAISSNGALSQYGFFDPVFTFAADGTVTSVVNKYGQPDPTRGRAAQLDPSGVNKYDLNTRTLKVSYIMTQGGSPRTYFDETFTYVGPR